MSHSANRPMITVLSIGEYIYTIIFFSVNTFFKKIDFLLQNYIILTIVYFSLKGFLW